LDDGKEGTWSDFDEDERENDGENDDEDERENQRSVIPAFGNCLYRQSL
jgi:hypothetical protein